MSQKIISKEVIAGAILHIADISEKLEEDDLNAINIMVEITPSQFKEAFLHYIAKNNTLN